MGLMTRPASASTKEILIRLDQRIRAVDEERWLSSRYAAEPKRNTLIVLYAFYYEIARVRVAVSDETMGLIRFQWWRDALSEMHEGQVRQHDVALALAAESKADALSLSGLSDLIDQHETAFLTDRRDAEPEAALAMLAAHVLQADWVADDAVLAVAAEWAALRRGETVTSNLPPVRIPSLIRPALAHLRLRRAWTAARKLGPLGTRGSVLQAILTGWI